MPLPLILEVDARHKITLLQDSPTTIYFKAEFKMDTDTWVINESYVLTKEQSARIAWALLDKAGELAGPPLKRRRRR